MRLDDNLAALILGETARLEVRVPMRWETHATAVRAQSACATPTACGQASTAGSTRCCQPVRRGLDDRVQHSALLRPRR